MTSLLVGLMKLTGGRPMKFEGHAFTDHVSGEAVRYYVDFFGRRWLATHSWSSFRVAPTSQEASDAVFASFWRVRPASRRAAD